MTASEAHRHRPLLRQHDRRRHWRVKVNLLGRFMLADRQEYPCQTNDMSPGSVGLTAATVGELGERVVLYLDHVGRVEGQIARVYEGGFALTIHSTPRKKDKLAAQLTWLANRHELRLPEDRRHERVIPKGALATRVCLPDGREYPATVIDMSLSGVAIAVKIKPPIGSPVTVGKLRAIVVRHFDEGFAAEFAVLQTMTSLEQNL